MTRDLCTEEIKIRVPLWLKKALEDASRRDDMALSQIVRRALKTYALTPRREQTAFKEIYC